MNSQQTSGDKVEALLATHAEAGLVLVVVGKIEDMLEKLLLTRGRRISNKLAKSIFGGMGPLSSLSAKIEIAYFFELIDEPSFDDLKLIKDIRNRFAHTTTFVFFSTEAILNKCKQLSTWNSGEDPQSCFYSRSLELIDALSQKLDVLMYAKALGDPPAVNVDDEGE